MSMHSSQSSQLTYSTMPEAVANPRKRKHMSDGDIERVNLPPKLRNSQTLSSPCLDDYQRYDEFQFCPAITIPPELTHQTCDDSVCPSQLWSSPSLTSYGGSSMLSGPPPGPGTLPNPKSVMSSCLSIGEWLKDVDSLSLNSVRPPDPFEIRNRRPGDLTHIAVCLYQPRPPPILPRHILDFDFSRVLRRYRRVAKLVDDYQYWHGRSIFAFWLADEITLAAAGEIPTLTKAYEEDRPSIPPRVLNTRFDIVLLAAPLLSHLIERYHKDLGFDYFAFYHNDPREHRNDSFFYM
ncbi:hypothetical protein EV127DRAFT_411975 [Xylaria flabelliformis]|nr:hypothetical protein EV127DRAFT_411975 [Xylaria flabelliformis]